MKKDKRYPEGYKPKLDYWVGRLETARDAGDMAKMIYAIKKLDYFSKREEERKAAIS